MVWSFLFESVGANGGHRAVAVAASLHWIRWLEKLQVPFQVYPEGSPESHWPRQLDCLFTYSCVCGAGPQVSDPHDGSRSVWKKENNYQRQRWNVDSSLFFFDLRRINKIWFLPSQFRRNFNQGPEKEHLVRKLLGHAATPNHWKRTFKSPKKWWLVR